MFASVSAEVCEQNPATTARSGMKAGAIVAVVDSALAYVAMRAIEDGWVATLDLSYASVDDLTTGPLVVSARLLRAGSAIVTTTCDVFDGEATDTCTRLVGSATGTFRRLPATAANGAGNQFDRGPTSGVRHRLSKTDDGFDRPLADAIGAVELEPGVLRIEKSAYVANSIGTINGGATAVFVGAAAESAAGGGAAADLLIRYTGQVREGPAQSRCTVVRRSVEQTVVEVEVLDTSNKGRLIALATVWVLQ